MNSICQKIDELNEGFSLPEQNSLAAVLQVLAVTVLIDNKIHSAEPQEFIQQIKNLRIFVTDHPEFSKVINIEQWCIQNWDSIRQILLSDDRLNYIEKSLELITCDFLRPMTYASMSQICRCDNEMHSSEINLLKQASISWELH